jgi:hypothetical protein
MLKNSVPSGFHGNFCGKIIFRGKKCYEISAVGFSVPIFGINKCPLNLRKETFCRKRCENWPHEIIAAFAAGVVVGCCIFIALLKILFCGGHQAVFTALALLLDFIVKITFPYYFTVCLV